VTGQINLGILRPVENIGSLRFFSTATVDYLLAVAKDSRSADLEKIGHRGGPGFSRCNFQEVKPGVIR
jgi:hypothetical protein